MSSLIIKDLLLQKRMALLSSIYIPLVILFLHSTGEPGPLAGPAAFAAAMVAVTYMLVGSACAYEDKSKADVVLNSMPVNRAQIVAARYLSVYVFMFIGVVYYLVITWAIRLAHLPVQVFPLSGEGLLAAVFAVTLMNCIYLPVFFKWGYIRSRMVSFIMFFTFFFGATILVDTVYKYRETPPVKTLLEYVAGQPGVVPVIGLIALIVLMLAVSYLISLNVYRHREF